MPRVNWTLMPSLAWAAGLVSWPGVYDGLAGTAERSARPKSRHIERGLTLVRLRFRWYFRTPGAGVRFLRRRTGKCRSEPAARRHTGLSPRLLR
jgi:hypothetical protein